MSKASEYFSATAETFDRYYKGRSDFQERFSVWTDLLDRYSTGRKTAVDMGCGTGIFSFYLARKGIRVIGIDAANQMIDICNRMKAEKGLQNVEFVRAEIPLRKELEVSKTEIVISSSLLEYIEDMDGAIKNICDILQKDGMLIVSFPNTKSFYRRMERIFFRWTGWPRYYSHVVNYIAADKVKELFEKKGFDAVEMKYYALGVGISRIIGSLLPSIFGANLVAFVFQKKND